MLKNIFIMIFSCVIIGILMLASQQDAFLKLSVLSSGDSSNYNSISSNSLSISGNGETKSKDNTVSGTSFDFSNLEFATGTEFNFLSLLDQVGKGIQDTQEKKYYKNLIEIYIEGSQGKYNNYPANLSPTPSFYAAMHKNETNWSDFIRKFVGEKYSKGIVDLRTSDEEVVKELVPNYKSLLGTGGVYANDGGDNYPDGPFQVILGGPNQHLDCKSIDSSKDTFDVYSFRDQLNVVSQTFSTSKKEILDSGVSSSSMVENMYASGKHNRGSYVRQAFGIAYESAKISLNTKSFLKSTSVSDSVVMKEQLYALEVIERGFVEYNLPYLEIYTSERKAAGSLSWIILLKDGWYLESKPSGSFSSGLSLLYGLSDDLNPVLKIFPEWTTEAIALEQISLKYTKKLPEALGIPQSECDTRYGTINGKYIDRIKQSQGSSGSYMFIYKNMGVKNSNYVNSDTTLVKVYDFVATQYWIQIGIVSDSAIVELALKAGMPETIDGKIIDPTNPSIFYTQNQDTYNPKYGNDANNLQAIVNLLQQPITDKQFATLTEGYIELGLPYSYGGGGNFYNGQNISVGQEGKTVSDFYAEGKPYAGRRMYDCSSFASVVASMGDFKEKGPPKYVTNSNGWISNVNIPRTVSYKGQDIDVTLSQINLDGSITNKSDKSQAQKLLDWANVIKPGDIVAKNGHAQVYIGKNCTSNSIVIPVEYTMSNKESITLKPGEPIWFNNGGGAKPDHTSGVSSFSDSGSNYWVFRIKYIQ